jgi:hypothetical protein
MPPLGFIKPMSLVENVQGASGGATAAGSDAITLTYADDGGV